MKYGDFEVYRVCNMYKYFVGNGFVRCMRSVYRYFERDVICKMYEEVYVDNLWDMDLVICMENIYRKYVWVFCEK